MNSILKVATLTVMLVVASALMAQTGIALSVGSTADAVHYHGTWTVGSTEFTNFDVKDSAADSNGYVNSIYLGALARNYGRQVSQPTAAMPSMSLPSLLHRFSSRRISPRIRSACTFEVAPARPSLRWAIRF